MVKTGIAMWEVRRLTPSHPRHYAVNTPLIFNTVQGLTCSYWKGGKDDAIYFKNINILKKLASQNSTQIFS